MDDHRYNLAQEKAAECEPSSPKKRKHEEAKRKRDRRRQKTRINIGVEFTRWKSLMREKCFRSDAEVACFLLDSYESSLTTPTPVKEEPFHVTAPALPIIGASSGTGSVERLDDITGTIKIEALEQSCERGPATYTLVKEEPFHVTAPALSTIGASSGTDRDERLGDITGTIKIEALEQRIDLADEGSPKFHQTDGGKDDDRCHEEMGGALKNAPSIDQHQFIGIDGTVHDQPACEDPPPEPCPIQPPLLPEPQHVLSEDDIIGARASVVYDDCLRQLASFLILPVAGCTVVLQTGAVCGCAPPFEINITSKGTAAIVEWICPNRHSVWRWSSQPLLKFGMQAGDFLLSTNILLSGNSYANVALLFKFMNIGMVNKNTFFSIQDTYCLDTIKDFWDGIRTEALGYSGGEDVLALADGRNDLPCHCAQNAFSPPVNVARGQLAALDEYFHRNRPTMKTAEGKEIVRLKKKNARRCSVYALKCEKTYDYIPDLQRMMVKRRIASGVGMPRKRSLRPDDPRGLV